MIFFVRMSSDLLSFHLLLFYKVEDKYYEISYLSLSIMIYGINKYTNIKQNKKSDTKTFKVAINIKITTLTIISRKIQTWYVFPHTVNHFI